MIYVPRPSDARNAAPFLKKRSKFKLTHYQGLKETDVSLHVEIDLRSKSPSPWPSPTSTRERGADGKSPDARCGVCTLRMAILARLDVF